MKQVLHTYHDWVYYKHTNDMSQAGDIPADYDQPIFSGEWCWNCRKQLKGVVMRWWALTGCPYCRHSFCD